MGAALDVEKQAERQQQPNSWQPHQASEMLVEPPPQEEEKPESFESSTPTPEQGQLQQRQPSTPDLAHRDPPADSAYGYVIAVCVLGQNAVTWGMATTFGVYLSFFLEGTDFSDATQLDYAFIGGLQIGVALLASPAINLLSKSLGFRVSMTVGLVCTTLGQVFAGLSYRIWQLYLSQGILFGLGVGCVFIPAIPILGQWFNKRRALAFGIGTGGSGVGGLVFSITTRAAIENISLKWAYIINGLISCVVLIPTILLMRPRVKSAEAKWAPFAWGYLLHPGFLFCLGWATFNLLGFVIGLFTLPTYATQGIGLSQSQGSVVQAVLSAAQMIGRPGIGMSLDLVGRLNMAIMAALISSLAVFLMWNFADSYAVLLAFAAVEGLTIGTIWSGSGPVVAEVVGVEHMGSAMAVYWVWAALPAIFAQPIGLELLSYSRESLGKTDEEAFRIMINFVAGAFFAAALSLYGAKVYLQKSWALFQKT